MAIKAHCSICAKLSEGPFVTLMYPYGYSQTACMDCLKRVPLGKFLKAELWQPAKIVGNIFENPELAERA